jgi:hypothetical protein
VSREQIVRAHMAERGWTYEPDRRGSSYHLNGAQLTVEEADDWLVSCGVLSWSGYRQAERLGQQHLYEQAQRAGTWGRV